MNASHLTLIELNEFNPDLVVRMVAGGGLPHLSRIVNWHRTDTTTDDAREHHGLDPWVQWVSVHSGAPSEKHGVIRLGDVPELSIPQLWERLDQIGVSSGVWGPMNAARNGAEACRFFLPDPWTFSERAYPESLNGLLGLPRYYSKNYVEPDLKRLAVEAVRLAAFQIRSPARWAAIAAIPRVVSTLLAGGLRDYVLFLLFDLVSALNFAAYKRHYRPNFALVFMNSVAHLQHHHWTEESIKSGPIAIGAPIIDLALGVVLQTLEPQEHCVVANGLTQRNVTNEAPQVLYRQRNPKAFLEHVDLRPVRVEQLMTHDGHVFFASRDARDHAANALSAARIQRFPLFDVTSSEGDPTRLFYQVAFWEPLTDSPRVTVNGVDFTFLEHFEPIVTRTGAHIPDGVVLSSEHLFPAAMYNHELGNRLFEYFAERTQ